MTNYEKIKQMSVEEMTEYFEENTCDCNGCINHNCKADFNKSCGEAMKMFLESEVEE